MPKNSSIVSIALVSLFSLGLTTSAINADTTKANSQNTTTKTIAVPTTNVAPTKTANSSSATATSTPNSSSTSSIVIPAKTVTQPKGTPTTSSVTTTPQKAKKVTPAKTQPTTVKKVTPKPISNDNTIARANSSQSKWQGKTIRTLNGTTWYFQNGQVLDNYGHIVAYVGQNGALIDQYGRFLANLNGKYIIDGSGTAIGELFDTPQKPKFNAPVVVPTSKKQTAPRRHSQVSQISTKKSQSKAQSNQKRTPKTQAAKVAIVQKELHMHRTNTKKIATPINTQKLLPNTGYQTSQNLLYIAGISLIILILGMGYSLFKNRF